MQGKALHGEQRTWTASGVLRRSDTYEHGDIVRSREFFDAHQV
jgi:hypothetical protein